MKNLTIPISHNFSKPNYAKNTLSVTSELNPINNLDEQHTTTANFIANPNELSDVFEAQLDFNFKELKSEDDENYRDINYNFQISKTKLFDYFEFVGYEFFVKYKPDFDIDDNGEILCMWYGKNHEVGSFRFSRNKYIGVALFKSKDYYSKSQVEINHNNALVITASLLNLVLT